jgi:beta-D-xylosidase 4
VVVLMNGGALSVEAWLPSVDALVEAWYPGELGGDALISLLFGASNRWGVLPVTMYDANFTAARPMLNMDLRADGGVTHQWYTGAPVFPFGFGLSYTTFSYAWANDSAAVPSGPVAAADLASRALPRVGYSVNVTNTGGRTGDAIVLAFIAGTPPATPYSQLWGFERITLVPGASQVVAFWGDAHAFSRVDEHGRRWLDPGHVHVRIGDVSAPAQHRLLLTGDASVELPRWRPAGVDL